MPEKEMSFALIRGHLISYLWLTTGTPGCTICHPISPDPAQAQALIKPQSVERDPNPPHARQLLQPGSALFSILVAVLASPRR